MANTSTEKIAPRIIINENDISSKKGKVMNQPVTLIFGFSPQGRTNEMVQCDSNLEILNEFGSPTSAPEKYFIDSAMRVVQNKATVLMTRLPYDNFQCHNVKYVDYKVQSSIAMKDIASGPAETKMREKDDAGVTILKEMNGIDTRMNQYQRIVQVSDSDTDIGINSMTNDEFNELELDQKGNLDSNTFRIVDIVGLQYGGGAGNIYYTGIFPVVVDAASALYYQGKIESSSEMDECFRMFDVESGIEMSTSWYRNSNKASSEYKVEQAKIVESIGQTLNIDTTTSRFRRNESFQDECVKTFPLINLLESDKLDKTNLGKVGILVCMIGWDSDQQISTLSIVESFVGKLGNGKDSVDRKINKSSKYIRMYKNLSIPADTDYFLCTNQKITSIGMQQRECEKYINYKTSIIDPITYMLENTYSDVDSIMLDVILDAGISSTAFQAYVDQDEDGNSYANGNELVRTKAGWANKTYDIDDSIDAYATVCQTLTRLFGDFIKNVRGDCVYIADGPRILNLEHNYPIRNYIDIDNIEMFNRYLPLFSGYTNNYVARYWNWVYIEDMQYDNRGFWVPPSVVIGSQLAYNDKNGHVWYAPAGMSRGIVDGAFDISVRTRQYTSENDLLYQNQWNFFNIYQNEGVVVEGQKTLQVKKTSLDRLNTRRMVCWIKQQIRIIANRYKYEPNTSTLRNAFVNDLTELLREVQRTSGISDFQILCNDTNNTTETIDRHELWCKIGIKPIKALEYIIIDLSVINGSVGMDDSKVVQVKG